MSLATLKEVLEIAERTNTAIPGFNIDNIEIPEAIMEAAEAENCPVILTIGQGAINAGGLRHLPDVVRRIAESSRGAGGHASGPRHQLRTGHHLPEGRFYFCHV